MNKMTNARKDMLRKYHQTKKQDKMEMYCDYARLEPFVD